MTVNDSRILTMDQKIPQAQVNNPDVLELTPLSPNQIQISAKATGVTQVNLWDEEQEALHDRRDRLSATPRNSSDAAVDVSQRGAEGRAGGQLGADLRLRRQAGAYRPDRADRRGVSIPKVINNMTVGGVQQVLLHVKVMEVSRTKLRQLGFDWAKITGSNVVTSGVSGADRRP